MKKLAKFFSLGAVLLLIVLLFGGYAAASGHLQTEYSFDPGNLEFPEGITIDKVGNMHVSLGPPFWFGGGFGEIWKISPDGTITTLVQFPGGPGPAGLAVDAPGNLYFAYPTGDISTNGVYLLPKSGEPVRLPGTEKIGLANGLAFDKQGDIYVSDSFGGAVWRIPLDGSGEAEIWYKDENEWLLGCGDVPVGANGIAYRQGSFYVANTSLGMLLEIPVLDDGSHGTAQIVAGDPDCDPLNDELFSMDGIAMDVHGDIYALLVIQNKLVKINPDDGSFTTLLTEADGLHNPTSIAFGTGKGARQRVFFTNYALFPGSTSSLGPAVLSLDVEVPGQPLP